MSGCPLFGRCGGCRFDFASPDYRAQKLSELKIDTTGAPVWFDAGLRRRADFAFATGKFGFYAPSSHDIVPVDNCPNLDADINKILPNVAALPWSGTGAVLITKCDNGIDIAITSSVPYFSNDFKRAAERVGAIRVSWNGAIVCQTSTPRVSFGDMSVDLPIGAFLQPTIHSADAIREMVVARANGARRVVDLFCGLGNFTFALNADGFDIAGPHNKRDLFKNPLSAGHLGQYDCVIMDPPRAGADAQCRELAHSNVPRVIYVSCNPATFARDMRTLTRGGYKVCEITPIDQFVGSGHWELFAVFEK